MRSKLLKNGEKFNKLTVIGLSHINEKGEEYYLCRCECGKTAVVRKSYLRNNKTKSCGCAKTYDYMYKHGGSGTRLYNIYQHMKDRCTNKNSTRYQGLPIQEDWLEDFANFKKWAEETGYNDDLFLSRKNILEGYNKDNCEWTTDRHNVNRVKKYTYKGETLTLSLFAEKYNIPVSKLQERVRKGLTIEQAIEFKPLTNSTVKEGDKFGKLTVLSKVPMSYNMRRIEFLCECECGNILEVGYKDLLSGKVTSCEECKGS